MPNRGRRDVRLAETDPGEAACGGGWFAVRMGTEAKPFNHATATRVTSAPPGRKDAGVYQDSSCEHASQGVCSRHEHVAGGQVRGAVAAETGGHYSHLIEAPNVAACPLPQAPPCGL